MTSVPRDQAAAAIGRVVDVLGQSLLGAYLYGSAIDGGLKPDSDLDLFGVIQHRLRAGERRRIVAELLRLSGRETRHPSWRPIELTLVVRGEVVPWRYPPPSTSSTASGSAPTSSSATSSRGRG